MNQELETALNAFLDSPDFVSGIVASTYYAGFGGSGYSVELFPDGHFRVLWDNQIGNKYDSPGVILGIPALSEKEYDDLMDIVNTDHTPYRTLQEEQQWLRDELSTQTDTLNELREEMKQR